MKQIIGIIFLFFSFFTLLLAQTANDLNELQKRYEAFEYSTVIAKAQNLLLDKERFSENDLIRIFTLKAASHYAMGNNTSARKAFIELLKLNDDFILSNVKYSPKLIELFNNVKEEFADILKTNREKPKKNNNELMDTGKPEKIINNSLSTSMAKSLLLPGWGHLHNKENTKGWILTSASSLTLGTLVYFIFDTNSKERSYLSEINSEFIQSKYEKYNSSYKIRNALIGAYAAIWIYSQIDLLFFSNSLGSKNITHAISHTFQPIGSNSITLSFQIGF